MWICICDYITKAAGLSPHSDSQWKRFLSQVAQEFGVPQLSCYTSFRLLNISVTFSNAHLVLLCYIFTFSNGFKHVKMSRMLQQGQFLLLRVLGLHKISQSVEPSLPSSEPPTFTILTVNWWSGQVLGSTHLL